MVSRVPHRWGLLSTFNWPLAGTSFEADRCGFGWKPKHNTGRRLVSAYIEFLGRYHLVFASE